MSDSRQRNVRHLSGSLDPVAIEWSNEKQRYCFEFGPSPLCASGGFNSGKTIAMVLKMLYVAELYPGYRWLVARRVWDELKKTTMASFFKFCPRSAWEPYGRRSDTEKVLRLNNGSEFIWMHLDDPDAMSILRGLEINGFFFDQAEELEEEAFIVTMTRVGRWDKVTVPDAVVADFEAGGKKWPFVHPQTGRKMPPSYKLLTCNPDSEDHWIYRRFHPNSDQWRETYKAHGYRMVQMASYENKFATPENLEEMRRQDDTWKLRFYEGEWGIPEGQIHNLREESLLAGTPEVLAYIKTRCTFHRTMDHGDSAPTSVLWWATDREGNVFAYREYYRPNRLISDHRNEVWALSRDEWYGSNLADPAIFAKNAQKGGQRWSVAEEWADAQGQPKETAVYWDRGDNDEFGTRNRISEYLRPSGYLEKKDGKTVEADRPHPITKEMGRWPRLFIVERSEDYPSGCYHLQREIRSQRRIKIGTDNGKPLFDDDRDAKVADHAYDCCRYFIASRPSLPGTFQRTAGANSFMKWRESAIRLKRRRHFSNMAAEAAKRGV